MFKKKRNDDTLNTSVSQKKKKKNKNNFASWFAGFLFSAIVCCIVGGYFAYNILADMLEGKPTINIADFQNSESSKIYDREGEVIAELGITIRENVSYDDLPNNLIDAFVAIEDSRYFEHNGFDLPRFVKAAIENVLSFSFSQGGSTFTMQLVKNTYFTNDSTGTIAANSIQRKVQEIALAFELEKLLSKEQILELYLNKLNYGGSGRAIRGIEKASLYYFGISAKEVDLSQAAFLAGVINSPTYYNPFYYLDLATERRNTVLYQMYNHGYITQGEYDEAVAVNLEDQLISDSSAIGSGHEAVQFQAYIDVVINEAFELGYDPYTTTMNIYTSMDRNVQTVMDNIQKGEVNGWFEFTDDYVECASIATNNHTGEIVGILGGRNYASGGQLLLNHATDQYKQPGSTSKVVLEYPLAFEYLGWATSQILLDEPVTYAGTNIIIKNSNNRYQGDVTLESAVVDSLNTTAIKTLQEVINKIGIVKCDDYAKAMGFSQAYNYDFNIQWGIGGGEFYVSVKEMASALAVLLNGGNYITPHTITKIEFANGASPFVPVYESKTVLSEQTCYLMSRLLKEVVNKNVYNDVIRERSYEIYSKTGTTDWGSDGLVYGIPETAIKDGWLIAGTADYSVATWYGYDKIYPEVSNYFTIGVWNQRIKEKITKLVLNATVESFGQPAYSITKPEGITEITHIKGVYPYVSPIEGMPSEYITTGLIATKNAKLNSPDDPYVENLYEDDCKINFNSNTFVLTIDWPEYPDKEKLTVASKTREMVLLGFEEDENGERVEKEVTDEEEENQIILVKATGNRAFDYSWIYGCIQYMAKIEILDENDVVVSTEIIKTSLNTHSSKIDIKPNQKLKVTMYYGYTDVDSISNEVEMPEIILENIDKEITTPDAGSSYDEVIKWANDNNIKVTVVKHTPTSKYTEGSWEIYDFNDEMLSIETKYTYSQYDLATKGIKVHYYYAGANYALSFSNKDMKVLKDKEYTITSNFAVTSWTIPSYITVISKETSGSTSTLKFKLTGEIGDQDIITISAKDKNYSASISLTASIEEKK